MAALNKSVFRATHNSYSGDSGGGQKGSIIAQLDSGVRLIELDIHANNFGGAGDFEIGHDSPGSEVWHGGGNPQTNLFADWCGMIAGWSAAHESHAPIQLVMDVKDSLVRAGVAFGDHAALNAALEDAFGPALVRPRDVADWPDAGALQGRIIAVLSGDQASRLAYPLDRGVTPAVAVNTRDVVVEVHESDKGDHALWYWVGRREAHGGVAWLRHGRYGSGTTPAVAINDEGWIVEVHQSQNSEHLWRQLGRLTPDLDIQWGQSIQYDSGILPTIRFTSPQGFDLREIHRSEAHDQNWSWDVALDPSVPKLSFSNNVKTNDPRWLASGSTFVSVWADDENLLLYSSPSVAAAAIAYEQVAFVEQQPGDPQLIRTRARFAAADASDGWLEDGGLSGLMRRGWQFSQGSPKLTPPENYLATDTPFAGWYDSYCTSLSTLA